MCGSCFKVNTQFINVCVCVSLNVKYYNGREIIQLRENNVPVVNTTIILLINSNRILLCSFL